MAKSKGNRTGLWIIVGLLCLGMIGFGSAGLNGGLRNIGTVGEKEISVNSYANALTAQINAFSQQTRNQISFAAAEQIGIPQLVRQQLVAQRAMDNEAANLGLSAGDERVFDMVTSMPAFQGLGGGFDRDGYRFALRNQGLTEEAFENTLREDLARGVLQTAIVTGTGEPRVYADALVQFIGERRSFTWATLDGSALEAEVADPTEEELRAHYEANPESYTAPETRQISYAWITPELMRDQVEVSEESIAELYQDRIDEFVIGERRLVERLVFPNEEAAESALARLTAGEVDFEGLVAERGLDLAAADMGDVDRGDLGPAADGVFAAETGDVVGPFNSSLGPALFRMNAVLQASETTLEEVRDDLRDELANARAVRLIRDMANPIADLTAGGATIADIAERTELIAGQIDWNTGVTDGIAAYDAFRAAAAQATEGALPELVELSDGGVFVMELDGIIPPALRPYEDVVEQVVTDRIAAATQEAVVAQTTALVTTLATTGDFEAAGLTPNVEVDLIRRDFVAGTPPNFMGLVFGMEEGDVSTMETADGTIIVQLDGIAAANLMDPTMAAETESILESVGSGIAQDIYTVFATEVQDRTDVNIDDQAIAYIHTQFR